MCTFSGPLTYLSSVPLDNMPVFLHANMERGSTREVYSGVGPLDTVGIRLLQALCLIVAVTMAAHKARLGSGFHTHTLSNLRCGSCNLCAHSVLRSEFQSLNGAFGIEWPIVVFLGHLILCHWSGHHRYRDHKPQLRYRCRGGRGNRPGTSSCRTRARYYVHEAEIQCIYLVKALWMGIGYKVRN